MRKFWCCRTDIPLYKASRHGERAGCVPGCVLFGRQRKPPFVAHGTMTSRRHCRRVNVTSLSLPQNQVVSGCTTLDHESLSQAKGSCSLWNEAPVDFCRGKTHDAFCVNLAPHFATFGPPVQRHGMRWRRPRHFGLNCCCDPALPRLAVLLK